jgi:hypothetical protein
VCVCDSMCAYLVCASTGGQLDAKVCECKTMVCVCVCVCVCWGMCAPVSGLLCAVSS